MICVACATGHCRDCRRTVSRGRVSRACACKHGAATQVVKTSDPRQVGGALVAAGPGDGETLLDTSRAVLLDSSDVCRVDVPSDGSAVMALFLEGRINRTTDRSAILYLLGPDGAAALVTELVGLAARMGPEFEGEFRQLLDDRMDVAELWPTKAPT